MAELLTAGSLIALLSLTALEIVLGIDNVVFLAVLAGRLPKNQQRAARIAGLMLAAVGRVLLLFVITWVVSLEHTHLFEIAEMTFTAKDLILILGGVFLLGKATWEIHHTLEADQEQPQHTGGASGFAVALVQILLLDLVFSIDSVLTAVGMVDPGSFTAKWVPLSIMITAIMISIAVMLTFAAPLTRFIERHPTMKMLALSFLLLVGVVLIGEGLEMHVPRGYIYFAMGFSLFVEVLNLKISARVRRRRAAAAR